MRAKFAEVGIAPGKSFDFAKFSDPQKAELGIGVKEGYDTIDKRRNNIGKNINGWLAGAAFGDPAFYHGDYLLRAAAALAGLYGNNADEATVRSLPTFREMLRQRIRRQTGYLRRMGQFI